MTIALSQRSAAIGLAQEAENLPGGVAWKSVPRARHHWYDACRPQRLRAVVSWTQAGSTAPQSASAELQACHIGMGELDALARSLAAALTSRPQQQAG